jgi:hypothetical protein
MGPRVWLDTCAPPGDASGLEPRLFALGDVDAVDDTLERVRDFAPHALVVFDPPAMGEGLQRALAQRVIDCATLGVLVGGLPHAGTGFDGRCCDRLVSFETALTGQRVAGAKVWRAIPPPVSDAFFGDVRRLHRPPRALTIGRSTMHREGIVEPAKHHHDLMQVLHGVSGPDLVALLGEYDVGVYVPPAAGPGFGAQVGIHLAAGQLLLAALLGPTHGLERGIDYLQVDSGDGLAWVLERLARFPEMYYRVRVRGRMKAEHFRASHLFARLVYDLLADVGAFGRA